MRCCLLGAVTTIALGLVAAALFLGVVGAFGPELAALAPGTGRAGATTTARVGTATAVVPVTPRPAGPTATRAAGETQLARLTEAELTQALQAALGGQKDAPLLENVRVTASGGRLTVRGVLRGLPLPVDVELSGRVEVSGGRPRIAVERVEGAGVPLPDGVRERLQEAVNAVNLLPVRGEVEITRVETGEGIVTIFGRRRA